MRHRFLTVPAAGVMAWFLSVPCFAQSIILQSDETRVLEEFSWVPYGFFSDSFGLGLGIGAGYSGWPAEESTVLGAATIGTRGSYNVAAGVSDLPVPGIRRLYVEPLAIFGKYQNQFLYFGQDNPGFENERAGSNESDPDNYVEATQWDNRVELAIRYLLPLGHGADPGRIVNRYVVREGLLESGASGGETWNPLASGRTTLTLTPQWREQTAENDDGSLPASTMNLEAELEYNNFDFPFNPSRGSLQRLSYKRDFDDDALLGEWELWTAELAKVFDLGRNGAFRQQVLAFNAWTAYVPTWEAENVDGRERVTRRPPLYDGAVLGGLNRMRAYEDDRFQDKAAIYYSAEYRVIPEWQPLRNIDALKIADISYWQWVLFVEAGRVAPSWNLSALHEDMKFDGGISLRGMLHNAVCRLDVAVGEEGARVVAMYGHPF